MKVNPHDTFVEVNANENNDDSDFEWPLDPLDINNLEPQDSGDHDPIAGSKLPQEDEDSDFEWPLDPMLDDQHNLATQDSESHEEPILKAASKLQLEEILKNFANVDFEVCQWCHEIFMSKAKLVQHSKQHNLKLYKCTHCHYQTSFFIDNFHSGKKCIFYF